MNTKSHVATYESICECVHVSSDSKACIHRFGNAQFAAYRCGRSHWCYRTNQNETQIEFCLHNFLIITTRSSPICSHIHPVHLSSYCRPTQSCQVEKKKATMRQHSNNSRICHYWIDITMCLQCWPGSHTTMTVWCEKGSCEHQKNMPASNRFNAYIIYMHGMPKNAFASMELQRGQYKHTTYVFYFAVCLMWNDRRLALLCTLVDDELSQRIFFLFLPTQTSSTHRLCI